MRSLLSSPLFEKENEENSNDGGNEKTKPNSEGGDDGQSYNMMMKVDKTAPLLSSPLFRLNTTTATTSNVGRRLRPNPIDPNRFSPPLAIDAHRKEVSINATMAEAMATMTTIPVHVRRKNVTQENKHLDYDELLRQVSSSIHDLIEMRDDLQRASVENAILLDSLHMCGALNHDDFESGQN